MNKVLVGQLQKMLQALSAKTGLTLSQKNLRTIGDLVDGIGEDYLYKKIYNPIQHRKRNELIGLRSDQLNCVARYLGYIDFVDFAESLEFKKDEQLLSLVGSYYCYVRSNITEGESVVLRSPVRIWEGKDRRTWFELKGPSQRYTGEVLNRYGCLFVLMEAESGKRFHHVYKIGRRKKPQVLQGTFSGVSTAFDPIGGRVVLSRADDRFDSLSSARLEIATLRKSTDLIEIKLAIYFNHYENNNVVPNRSSTFDVGDL